MSDYLEVDLRNDEGVQADVCELLDRASQLYDQACDKLKAAQQLHEKVRDPELRKAVERIDTSSPDEAEMEEARISAIDLWDKLPKGGLLMDGCHFCKGPIARGEEVKIEGAIGGYDAETCEIKPLCWNCYVVHVVRPLEAAGLQFKKWKFDYCGG